MEDFALKVEHVSKSFKLPHEKQSSLKGALINFRKRGYEKQQVLQDIDFEIKKGEFFGIVGRNGSGKSTLLKLMAGIYSPDSGQVHVRGKLTPFIELGVGFNPELTGRENVYLNGALLGFNHKEMDAMYDEIVSFAELERFMDQKLKNYSSGMQVRLAFSIAIRAKSDILLIDEVLAVGDADFQQKCYKYFDELKENKQTIILVSHDMGAVKQFCDRALLLSEGQSTKEGSPQDVALEYEKLNLGRPQQDGNNPPEDNEKKVTISIMHDGKKIRGVQSGDEVQVKVAWDKSLTVKNIGLVVYKNQELVFATNSFNAPRGFIKGTEATLRFKASLGDGRYKIRAGLFGPQDKRKPIGIFGGETFAVYGAPAKNENGDDIEGIVHLPVQWID